METEASSRSFPLSKNAATHLASAALVVLGLLLPDPWSRPLLYVGLFALSGAVTNKLAIHMLFERVPGLYGSGVIPERFEEIKEEIRTLVMEQFFSPRQLEQFFTRRGEHGEPAYRFDGIIEETDLSPAFDALVAVVFGSSAGGLLRTLGGPSALEPLREPFEAKMKQAFKDLAATRSFQTAVRSQLTSRSAQEAMREKVEALVEERLDELTAEKVKEIMEKMIHDHLGWLVVWGGVFGGLMGLVTSFLPFV